MDTMKVVGGVVLVLVAIWMFIALGNPWARYLGGIVVLALGVWALIAGIKKGGAVAPLQPAQPQPEEGKPEEKKEGES